MFVNKIVRYDFEAINHYIIYTMSLDDPRENTGADL